MGTFLLVIVVFKAAVAGHAKAAYIAVGRTRLTSGMALGAGVLAVGPISNACLNPARAVGAIVTGSVGMKDFDQWKYFWVFIIAPLLAGDLSSLFQAHSSVFSSPLCSNRSMTPRTSVQHSKTLAVGFI